MKHLEIEVQNKLKLWQNASKIYYSESVEESPLSDSEFDILTRELIAIGDEYITNIVTKKIQTVDGLVDANEVKTEMISLAKFNWVQNKTTLLIRDMCKFLDVSINELFNIYVSLKFDGHAIKVVYKGGEIVEILTRGGVIYTELLKDSIPAQLLTSELIKNNYSLENNIYHCELLLKKDVYNTHYSTQYKNPRNAVSGVVKLEPNHLSIVPLTDGISPLIRMGNWFTVDDFIKRNLASVGDYSFNNLMDIYYKFKSDKFPYRVDGLVFGYCTETQIVKDNYPKNLVSLKFDAVTAITTINGCIWTQKKTGKLTPVYQLEPTMLDGSEVKQASGYNYASMLELKAGIGAIVEIEKSNDIIPKVIRVIKTSKEYILPDVPYHISGREIYATENEVSKEQKFILGLRTLNIEGIGEKTAHLIGSVLNYDIIELFNVNNKLKLLKLLGGDSANYKKICNVYEIKTLALDELIQLLQFNGVGVVLSNRFALIFTKMSNNLDNIDRNVVQFMLKGDGLKQLNESMNRIKSYGVKIIKPIEINDATLTFEMSGNPTDCNAKTKDEFLVLFKRKFPNAIKTTLNKNTKLLIVDNVNSSTSKANKARKYNIEIISYKDALDSYKPNFTDDNE